MEPFQFLSMSCPAACGWGVGIPSLIRLLGLDVGTLCLDLDLSLAFLGVHSLTVAGWIWFLFWYRADIFTMEGHLKPRGGNAVDEPGWWELFVASLWTLCPYMVITAF